MIGEKRWNSIRWRIVSIYFLLVFIAMTIIGVFIINQLEAYQLRSTSDNLSQTVKGGLLASFEDYDELRNHKKEVESNLDEWKNGLQEEIFVVDDHFTIIASSNKSFTGKTATGLLNENLILSALNGEKVEADSETNTGEGTPTKIKNMAFPIINHTDEKEEDGRAIGVLYVRADLTSIYDMLGESKIIFVRAMALALLITVLLGFLIARSITDPINDVAEKAAKMAQGNFSQEVAVSVQSEDEIGRLAEMFNLLRRQLDETLSETSNEKSKLGAILKYMTDGLIAIDLSGNIIHTNPAALKMLNITEEEAENKSYDEVIAKYSETLFLESLRAECKKGGGQENFDYNGSTFFVRYARFKDEGNNDAGIIMVFQDITEQQKVEKMQTDFVANVSHELKTPLTTIKSYTETLLEGAVEDLETQRNFLSIVDTETDRMNRLVKDLLQLSRLDHKMESWKKKDSNIIALLKSVAMKVEITAVNKEQHLNCLFDDKQNILVFMDKDRIEQALLNIISNAIKYTPDGGRIDIDVLKDEGREVSILISDNGIGIPEEEQTRIFERFYRVDKARSRAIGGTGLGLAIAKQIIEEHGGRIEVESKLGKGTKVSVSLPASRIRGQSNID